MRTFFPALNLALVAILFAGCSGSNRAVQPPYVPSEPLAEGTPLPATVQAPALPGWLAPETRSKSEPLLYVSVEETSQILIYPEADYNHSPIGMITSGVSDPWGLYVDKNGNLYVANQTNTVTVYPAGSVNPSAVYSQDLCHPLFPMVDRQGDLFVANGRSCGSGPATVVEYLPGSSTPYQVLQLPATEVDGMDFDAQDNLYVAYRVTANRGHGGIEKFAPGSTQGQILGMTVHKPQGLVVDAQGNILMVDTSKTTRDVVVYAPGARHPNVRVKLPHGSIPNQIAITEKETKLFVSSYNDGYIYVTDYPLTKYSTWTVLEHPGSIIQGVALSNGQVF